MKALKQVLLIVLLVIVIVVMVQNAQPVTFHFLNWSYHVSQLLLVVIVFALGFLTGLVVARFPRRKHDETQ